jgi:hypothetical protein
MLATPTVASEGLTPLSELLSTQPEASYQFARCAAFHLANIEWAGQALSEEYFEEAKSGISALLLVASIQRAGNDGDVEHHASMVNVDTRNIADFYLASFRESYALRGKAWEGNALWESDAETCKPIMELALLFRAELEQGEPQ